MVSIMFTACIVVFSLYYYRWRHPHFYSPTTTGTPPVLYHLQFIILIILDRIDTNRTQCSFSRIISRMIKRIPPTFILYNRAMSRFFTMRIHICAAWSEWSQRIVRHRILHPVTSLTTRMIIRMAQIIVAFVLMYPRCLMKISKTTQRTHYSIQFSPVILAQFSTPTAFAGTAGINIRLSVIVYKYTRINRRRNTVNHSFHPELCRRLLTGCYKDAPRISVNLMREIKII